MHFVQDEPALYQGTSHVLNPCFLQIVLCVYVSDWWQPASGCASSTGPQSLTYQVTSIQSLSSHWRVSPHTNNGGYIACRETFLEARSWTSLLDHSWRFFSKVSSLKRAHLCLIVGVSTDAAWSHLLKDHSDQVDEIVCLLCGLVCTYRHF